MASEGPGLGRLFRKSREQGDFSDLGGVDHTANRFLRQYRNRGGGYGFVETAVDGGTSEGSPE